MNITVFEASDAERDAFRVLETDHVVRYVAEPLGPANAAAHADAEIVSVFVHSILRGDLLQRLPNLRLVATRSTGIDHIDTRYCEEHGIRVANVPSYGKNTVAEHTFGLLLAISHRLVEATERARSGPFSATGLRGFDLAGKTIGVVGTGDIGRCVVQIALGFGMRVLAYDIQPDDAFARQLGFDYVPLDTLLRGSDVVTLHVPLTESTRHLLGRRELAAMRDGAVLINTARGEVVDAEALIEALSSGKLHAAGLDVVSEEAALQDSTTLLRRIAQGDAVRSALLASHVLLRHPAVVATPHSAFNTHEAVRRINETTIANVVAFANGSRAGVGGGTATPLAVSEMGKA